MKSMRLSTRLYSLIQTFFWVLAVCSFLGCFVYLYFHQSDVLNLAPLLAIVGLVSELTAVLMRDLPRDVGQMKSHWKLLGFGSRGDTLVTSFFLLICGGSLVASIMLNLLYRGNDLEDLTSVLIAPGVISAVILVILRVVPFIISYAKSMGLGSLLYSFFTAAVCVLLFGSVLFLIAAGVFSDGQTTAQLAVFIIPIDFILGIIAFIFEGRIRRARAGLILEYIDQAVRLNLPLAPMMLAAADSENGVTRRRLMRLHDHLERGEPLADAVRHAVPEIRGTTVQAIEAAAEIGRLPQLMRRIVRRNMPPLSSTENLDGFYRGYALLVIFFMIAGIGAMIYYVIMPKYESILKSFNAPLPVTTQWLLGFYHSYIPYYVVGVMLLIACIPATGKLRDYLLWFVPVAGSTARDSGLADMCGFMVDALEVGRPLDSALASAAAAQPHAIIRKRIEKWGHLIAAGESMSDAARRAHMPDVLVGMLRTVRDTDGLMQVLMFLSRHFESRFTRLREFTRAAVVPGLVMFMGAAVLLVCLSVFQPMVLMINLNAARDFGGF